jgi:hypothetical protein
MGYSGQISAHARTGQSGLFPTMLSEFTVEVLSKIGSNSPLRDAVSSKRES